MKKVLHIVIVALLTAQSTWAAGALFLWRFYGYVGLGLSGWLFAESIEARGDADKAYERYENATTSVNSQTFFDESRRFDTRKLVTGAMGLGAWYPSWLSSLSSGAGERGKGEGKMGKGE